MQPPMHITCKEYKHLIKTKKGLDRSINEKKVELSRACRAVVSNDEELRTAKLMAEIILEQINGK